MRFLSRAFLKGALAVLPLVVTIFLIAWLVGAFEASLGAALRWALPKGWYLPGLGFVLGIGVILAVGVLLQAYFMRRLFALWERALARIPFVKFVYGSVRELVQYFDKDGASGSARTVVSVSADDDGTRMIGLVTRDDLTEFGDASPDLVAVYLPWSYQMGGFTVFVPRSRITPMGMSVEEGLKFVLTAGVARGAKAAPKPAENSADSA